MTGVPLETLVNDPEDALSDQTPFFLVEVEGDYRFPSPNRITLERGTGVNKAGKSGELYLIVKPGWSCEVKIYVENRGFFTGALGREAVQDGFPSGAFDVRSSSFADDGGRSLYFTARGGSMIAVSADGLRPLGDQWGSGYFEREADARGIREVSRLKDGILLSLTAPYGNYSDPSTYSLRFNDPGAEVDVTIITATNVQAETGDSVVDSIRPDEGGVTRTPVQDSQGYGEPIVIAEGTDVDGDGWSVVIREDLALNTWTVVVDGVIKESGLTEDEARDLAADYADARERQALTSDDDRKPDTAIETPEGGIPWLGILAGAFIVVAILVGVNSFARGAGSAAVSGGSDGEE